MPISGPDPLLDIAGLSTGYGKIGVLRGVDLKVGAGEVVALLGPNGAGKTTLLRAVSGLLPWSGRVHFGGRDLAGASPRETVKAGLSHVIEGHRVFTQLERARQPAAGGLRPAAPRARYARRGGAGAVPRNRGQAPASAPPHCPAASSRCSRWRRAWCGGRACLMLDEPSAGLSPVLVDRVLVVVQRLREGGTAVLLVEQLIEKALAVADRVYALARGSIVLEAETGEADLPDRLEHAYLATGGVARQARCRIDTRRRPTLSSQDRNRQHHDPPHRRAGGSVLRGDAIFPDHDQGTARREPGLAAAEIHRCQGQADALHPELHRADTAPHHHDR